MEPPAAAQDFFESRKHLIDTYRAHPRNMPLKAQTAEQFEAWASAARAKFIELTGFDRMTGAAANPRRTGADVDCGDYVREHLADRHRAGRHDAVLPPSAQRRQGGRPGGDLLPRARGGQGRRRGRHRRPGGRPGGRHLRLRLRGAVRPGRDAGVLPRRPRVRPAPRDRRPQEPRAEFLRLPPGGRAADGPHRRGHAHLRPGAAGGPHAGPQRRAGGSHRLRGLQRRGLADPGGGDYRRAPGLPWSSAGTSTRWRPRCYSTSTCAPATPCRTCGSTSRWATWRP